MSNTPLALPPLDLLIHNLIALIVAIVLVMLLSELVVATILSASRFALRASIFSAVTEEERAALRKRVRRQALIMVALINLGLLGAALIASFTGRRALDLARGWLVQLRSEDLSSLRAAGFAVVRIAVLALITDALARALAAGLGKGLSSSAWFTKHRAPLSDVIKRLRIALRVTILCAAVFLIAGTLGLPEGARRAVAIGTYAFSAFYIARLVVGVAYILVDLLFETSGRLSSFESPLRYLGGLTHLAGLTKRTVDYFVYVGAATLVADELTPDTWIARVGGIGVRAIAIFYTSRVLVELCSIFVKEFFLTKTEEMDPGTFQQRKTLVPVAMGLVRYGIYFSALLMVLRAADIDTTPLLAGAGVLGVAVGLGAQAFVGDIVAGFFILFENLLLVGDLVEVSSVRGVVEEIGVRITKIRDDAGVLHAIPNGEVRKVANHSKGYVNAVVDVYVPYEEDLRRVRSILSSSVQKVLEEETGQRGPVEVNVEELGEGSILLRVVARVPPGKDEDLGDAMRASVVDDLRSAGIGAPRARRAVLIDSALRVGAPAEKEEDEGEEATPSPFAPPSGGD
ncbi:mechanosensitive ion channel family protein [Sorangium sp. So ce131]|uniref:mechanosensitive ion channel family protein n=1 Tax=Sorangium sp. So ce131 TaxID=3133282 RepID=UPI003F620019